MKYLIPFSLFEALELPIARKATQVFLDSGGKTRYNEYFKGKDRIYLDFSEGDDLSDTGEGVESVLSDNGYEMISYFKGLCRKKSDPKNILKIQRILNKLGMTDLKNRMDKDRSRASSTKGEKKVVISRHGIDLAGSSTDRDWTSCRKIKLDSDWNWEDEPVFNEIEEGVLIAYLINSDDLNIKNPIARIIISPFVNENDPIDILLYPNSEQTYGNASESFFRFVENESLEITKKINPKFNRKRGNIIYEIKPNCFWDDFDRINRLEGEIVSLTQIIEFLDDEEMPPIFSNANINIRMNNFFDMIVSEGFPKKEGYQKEINSILQFLNKPSNKKMFNILDALEISESKINEFIKKYPDIFAIYLKNVRNKSDEIEYLYRINDAKAKAIVESYISVFIDRIEGDITLESVKDLFYKMVGEKYTSNSLIDWIMKKANEFGMIL